MLWPVRFESNELRPGVPVKHLLAITRQWEEGRGDMHPLLLLQFLKLALSLFSPAP